MCCFPCDSTTLEVFFIVFSCFFYVSCGSSYSNKSLLQSKDILCHICRLLHKVFCFREGRSWSKMLSCKWWSSHSLRNRSLGDVCPVLHRCWFLPGPAATSIHLPIPEANRQWSSMVRGETFIIKSCWFHADFQMDLLLPGMLARLPKSWGFSCQTFAILAGHIFCHLVAYFKSFHCIFQAMEAWNVVDINGDIEAWCRRFCISRLQ